MSTIDEIRAAFLELESEPTVSGQFTWAGKSYPCLAGSASRSKKLEVGGWNLAAGLVILVRANLFDATPPQEKKIIEYDGRKWRIDEIRTPAGRPFLKLICNDPSQGV